MQPIHQTATLLSRRGNDEPARSAAKKMDELLESAAREIEELAASVEFDISEITEDELTALPSLDEGTQDDDESAVLKATATSNTAQSARRMPPIFRPSGTG